MSPPPPSDRNQASLDDARFEYRVWGKQRSARKMLEKLADETSLERVEDCYLLVDDPAVNLKIRDNTLKIKQLVAERKGFERWTSDRHLTADTVPSPFDELFESLRLDRPQRGKKFDLRSEIGRLGPDSGVRPVFVSKERRRYRIGSIRAESTDIEIEESGDQLHTLSIAGDDLTELRSLRNRLGLRDEDNIAVHHVIDDVTD